MNNTQQREHRELMTAIDKARQAFQDEQAGVYYILQDAIDNGQGHLTDHQWNRAFEACHRAKVKRAAWTKLVDKINMNQL